MSKFCYQFQTSIVNFQQKNSGWEGAIRTNAIFYTPNLPSPGSIRNQLIHVADLLPTVAAINGVPITKPIDGVNQWNVIRYGDDAVRDEIINIDNVLGFSSYINNPYKLVNGSTFNGSFDGWLSAKTIEQNGNPYDYAISVLESDVSRAIFSLSNRRVFDADEIIKMRARATVSCGNGPKKSCDLKLGPCLFDIYKDPCEENNLAASKKSTVQSMLARLNSISIVPSRRQKPDPAANPANFNGQWQWWQPDSN